MSARIDFFYFYGSIHTYLSVMRIEALASPTRIPIRWRPFNLRKILMEQNNTSFAKNQVRLNYNWRDTFKAWFLERKTSGLPDNVEAVLEGLGRPSREIIERAATPEIDAWLEGETDAARQLGIFGSPTFAVGAELFWGDDRLEDAIAYARSPA